MSKSEFLKVLENASKKDIERLYDFLLDKHNQFYSTQQANFIERLLRALESEKK